jgi:DNA-binding transcriptional MerR regulator
MAVKSSPKVSAGFSNVKHMNINKFAELSGINKSTLMYYDKIGVFTAEQRGDNNYRQYSPKQLTSVNQIRVMGSLGVPIKTMQEIAGKRSPESITNIINDSIEHIDAQIKFLKQSRSIGETLKAMLAEGMEAEANGETDIIVEKEMPELRLTTGDEIDRENCTNFFAPFLDFLSVSVGRGNDPSFPIGGVFFNFDEFTVNSSIPNAYYYVFPKGKDSRPAGRYVVGYARGYYGEVGDIACRIGDYMKKNKLRPVGRVYNTYLFDEVSRTDHDKYLMQALVQVEAGYKEK